jgi:hypothetical protein
MTALEPCPNCQRHVRTPATLCPFCSAPLAGSSSRNRSPSGRRLGRFAALTFQTGLVATALSCSESTLVPGPPGSGGAPSGGATGSGGGAPASGGTVGVGGSSSGGESAVGGMAGEDGSGGATGATGIDDGSGGDDGATPIYSAVPLPE